MSERREFSFSIHFVCQFRWKKEILILWGCVSGLFLLVSQNECVTFLLLDSCNDIVLLFFLSKTSKDRSLLF